MQNKPGTVATGTPLDQKDWTSFIEAIRESNPTKREEGVKSFVDYLRRNHKLEYFSGILTECSMIVEQEGGSPASH